MFDTGLFTVRASAIWLALCCIGLSAAAPTHSWAQLPATRLASLFPSGAQPGSEVEVVIAGADLDAIGFDGAEKLHFSHGGITAEPKIVEPGPFDEGPQRVANAFAVKVAGNVPPGQYEVRAEGRYGISNPRAFVVTDQSQALEQEPNDTPEEANELTWPGELSARCDQQGDVDYYRFTAEAGQRLIVRCLGRRIDSRIRPVLALYDAEGKELKTVREGPQEDAVLDFTPPSSGDYLLKVHDARYNGGDDYFYRLQVGPLPHIDFVFPPAGQAGGNRPFTLYGRNLPGGQPSEFSLDGRPLEKLTVNVAMPGGSAQGELVYSGQLDSASAGLDGKEFRLESPAGRSNPVLLGIADSPVVLEQEPNNTAEQAQMVELPAEIAGQFYPQRDRDWYQFEANEGDEIVVELFSQRLARPTDPILHVERTLPPPETETPEEGDAQEEPPKPQIETVATSDDAPHVGAGEFSIRTLDPAVRFTAPADGVYRVMVRDGISEVVGDPRNVYRLVIRQPQPDFRLAAAPGSPSGGSLQIRKGGQERIRVVAYRRDGFEGEIHLKATGLPSGVTCPDVVIGPASDVATMVLTAADNAPAGLAKIEVSGEAEIEGKPIKQAARFGAPLWPLPPRQGGQVQQPGPARLTRDLVVSVSDDEKSLASLQAGEGKVWETSRAGILKIPYAVTRREGFSGNLTCIVDELPPNANAPQFTINGNQASGEFQINLRNNTPPGTYTIHVAALAQPLEYSRNPEATERAEALKEKMEKVLADLTTKNQEAIAARNAANQEVNRATNALNAANTAKETADRLAREAAEAAKVAAETAAKAQAEAAADKENEALASAATATQKAAEEAAEKAKLAENAAAEATKNQEEAAAEHEAALEDKDAKDQAAEEAAELLTKGREAKAEADRQFNLRNNISRRQNINNVYFPSTTFTVKVAPFPITLKLDSEAVTVKQGEQLELPVSIARLYDFADQVTFNTQMPPGVGGISVPNLQIPGGQTQGNITINANANATEGEHQVTIRANLNFNGQGLTVEQPLSLTVEKVEPEE